jgi:hypothetical protein
MLSSASRVCALASAFTARFHGLGSLAREAGNYFCVAVQSVVFGPEVAVPSIFLPLTLPA